MKLFQQHFDFIHGQALLEGTTVVPAGLSLEMRKECLGSNGERLARKNQADREHAAVREEARQDQADTFAGDIANLRSPLALDLRDDAGGMEIAGKTKGVSSFRQKHPAGLEIHST